MYKQEVKGDIASLYSGLQPDELVSFPTFFPTTSQYLLPCNLLSMFFSLLALCLSTIWPYCSHNRISHSKSSHFTLHLNSECFLMQPFFFLENTSSGVSKESVWTPSQEKQRVGKVLIFFLDSNTNMIGTGGCLISLYSQKRCGVEQGETTAKSLSNLLADILW